MKKKIILIPSRYNSSRLYGKALLPLEGIPLIVHTYKRAELSKLKDDLYVCTDSSKIVNVCKKYNLNYIKTSNNHKNGTERICEAAKKLKLKKDDIVIDVQGDEPLVDPNNIDKTIKFFQKSQNQFDLVVPHFIIKNKTGRNVVKIISAKNRVLWMSRKNIPLDFKVKKVLYKKHLSIIVFKNSALTEFSKLGDGFHERIESIELLRAIENNMKVGTLELKGDSFSVDIKQDYLKAQSFLKRDRIKIKYLKKINQIKRSF
jgi:3-deoxy-manno-octulosonate cytidylyltransferase (CMP-KDO synthetase)